VGKSKKIWGAAFKGQDYYADEPPLIISVGHKICLDTAIKIVSKSCIKYCPEPVVFFTDLKRYNFLQF